MIRILPTLLALTPASFVFGTTWAPIELTDPLSGDPVAAHDVMSYGGYIYHWPSKYGQVFWPFTDEKWICFNPENGYAAFNEDFETLSASEKKRLGPWLLRNYDPDRAPDSHEEKLAWLEKVYQQRDMDGEFWSAFYRLMAYVHGDAPEKSMLYVWKALPLLENKLRSNPVGTDRLETLYLLGEYSRRTGDIERARELLRQIKSVKYTDEDGRERTRHPYYVGLAKERMKLLRDGARDGARPHLRAARRS